MSQGYKKLKEERKRHHMSCKDMAILLNISPGYYWQVENGTRRLLYDLAVRIAEIFQMKPDDLFY